ncbi:hypothetical protein FHS85_001472 [Rhodoligotrophos appendicifer]|uniref:hypothetical protein n=1 Tax=Rhodoligotrophos appendicifer TaxID=987056 RepID=UPI001185C44B|nr:hypothetical protein [Rhodoligotrophos appendicifer]
MAVVSVEELEALMRRYRTAKVAFFSQIFVLEKTLRSPSRRGFGFEHDIRAAVYAAQSSLHDARRLIKEAARRRNAHADSVLERADGEACCHAMVLERLLTEQHVIDAAQGLDHHVNEFVGTLRAVGRHLFHVYQPLAEASVASPAGSRQAGLP